jgi:putative methyltransferase (TIGR04325 family)
VYQPESVWSEPAKAVLDFGGGCGLHYKSVKSFDVRWAVVETPAMVRRAKEFETSQLKFFDNIPDAACWLGPVDVMHSDGALQYTPHPEDTLRELVSLKSKIMVWKRTNFSENKVVEFQTSHLIDNGPGIATTKNKLVKYPVTRMPENVFLAAHGGYQLTTRAKSSFRFVRECA